VSLIIGIVAGLFLSSFIETPLNPAKEVTRIVTNTTTTTRVNTALALWPYALSFKQWGVGPYNWGYDININPNGSAMISYHRDKIGTTNLTINIEVLNELSFLFLKANIFHLNKSYEVKYGYYDWGFYNLTLTTHNQTKSVSWAAGESAVESTPKELHEIEDYLNKIAFKIIP